MLDTPKIEEDNVFYINNKGDTILYGSNFATSCSYQANPDAVDCQLDLCQPSCNSQDGITNNSTTSTCTFSEDPVSMGLQRNGSNITYYWNLTNAIGSSSTEETAVKILPIESMVFVSISFKEYLLYY